ncbi:1-aminocyclopropane-1-carboxylate oxidase homolog 6 [Linum perenne]
MSRGRKEVVGEIRVAAETWGLFQMVNHGIPMSVMEEMLDAVSRFHEQPAEAKAEIYSRDSRRKVRYFSNGDLLVSKSPANWRDTLAFYFEDGYLDPQLFPQVCRDYLSSIECMETVSFLCHYYPHCPQPHLTLGATNHMDPSFLTILMQDHKGGLQVLHQDHWVNVTPLPGALLITNDKFKSAEHRVVVGDDKVGSRASVASLFYPSSSYKLTPYGPPKELLSHGSPAIYRDTHFTEFMAHFRSKGLDGKPALTHFKRP